MWLQAQDESSLSPPHAELMAETWLSSPWKRIIINIISFLYDLPLRPSASSPSSNSWNEIKVSGGSLASVVVVESFSPQQQEKKGRRKNFNSSSSGLFI